MKELSNGLRLTRARVYLNIREVLNFPCAITELFGPHAHPVQQRQPQVGLGRIVVRINDVPARL